MTLVDTETGEVVEPLSADEEAAHVADEATIGQGLQSFIDVGDALARVRDRRSYRIQYRTFEEYCQTRWGFSRSRAHRLIEAAEVVELLPIGNKPANEAQARELAKAPPEHRAEAWTAAVERTNGKPTAKAVEEAVADIVSKETAKSTARNDSKAFEKKMTPDGFDPEQDRQLTTERGHLRGTFREFERFGDPAALVERHQDHMTALQQIAEHADAAHEWLAGFLAAMEEHR